jgi:FkbM family methyltransferase
MPSVLTKPVKFCRKKLSEACLDRAMRRDGASCTRLLNLAAALKKTGVSFRYDPKTKIYSYIGEGYEKPVHFFHKKRAIMYRKGIVARTSLLARDYFLSRITFGDGDTVMDCGANIGELYLWFVLNGLSIRYVAFEPSPLEFQALRLNCPEAEGHNVALWNRNETLRFYLASEDADSSVIEPAQHQGAIAVEARRLDDYITRPVRLLKLEAEGAEPEILEGIGEKLPLIHYIAADLGFERGVERESTLAPVTNMLLRRNFSLVDVAYPRVTALFKNDKLP